MKFNIQNTLITLVLLISLLLRIYRLEIPGVLSSKWGDGFRDYSVAHYIHSFSERPLLGPFNLLYDSGIRNSPIYFYILSLLLTIRDDLIVLSLANIFLQILSIFLIYLITKQLFGQSAALVATVLFSFTPEILRQSQYIWQPTLMQPIALLALYLLIKAYFGKNYQALIGSITLITISVTIHNSIFSWSPQFLILSFLILKLYKKSWRFYLGVVVSLILTASILYLPVFIYLGQRGVLIDHHSLLYTNSLTAYSSNLAYNFWQVFQVFSINKSLLILLILVCLIYLKIEKSVKKTFFLLGLLFFLQPIFISSLFNKNQLHYLSSSFGLFTILVSVVINKLFKNRYLLIVITILLFKIFSQDFNFLYPPKEEAGSYKLINLAADTTTGEAEKIDNHSFQVVSFAKRGTTFRYPILDTVLLVPLEKKLNTKLAKISDDSPYNLVQTNDNKYVFITCFEFDHPSLVSDCSTSFLATFPNYKVEKNIYNQYPISIYLARKHD